LTECRFGKITAFVLFYFCLSSTLLNGQISLDQCENLEISFTGEAAETLCDQYGDQEHPVLLGEGTALEESLDIGTGISNKDVHIVGDFYITNNFNFTNCIVKIDPGVSIIVLTPTRPQTSFLFVIDNSKLFACDDLWSGIILWPNTSIMTKNQTIIEDAEVAIQADYSTNGLFIENTTFNRNHVGIKMLGSSNKNGVIYRFKSNTFKCDSPLNGTIDEISFAGIWTKNYSVVTIRPKSIATRNTFMNLQYGILAEGEGTVLTGRYLDFKDMKIAGIYVETGIVNLEYSQFYNNDPYGIYVNKLKELNLEQCTFNFDENLSDPGEIGHFRDAVYAYSCLLKSSIRVNNCTFNADLTNVYKNVRGIHIGGGIIDNYTSIIIEESTWNFVGAAFRGILITGDFPRTSLIDISHNLFNCGPPSWTYESYVIECSGGNKYSLSIFSNTFVNDWYDLTGSNVHGILLEGSEGLNNEVNDNRFPSSEEYPVIPLSAYFSGIDIKNFNFSTFCSNVFYNNGYCFYFTGINMMTNLVANHAHSNQLIRIYEDGWIDDQDQKGNTWQLNTSWILVATYHALLDDADAAKYSEFNVHTPQSTTLIGVNNNPYHPKNISPDSNDEWWSMHSGEPEEDCASQLDDPIVTKVQKDIADGLIVNLLGDSSRVWQAERSLYYILSEFPDLVSQHTSFSSFISSHSSTPIGKIYQIRHLIDSTNCERVTLIDSIYKTKHLLDSLIIELEPVDSILDTTSSSIVLAANVSSKTNIVDSIYYFIDLLNFQYIEYLNGRKASLNSIIGKINLISPTNQQEIDEKVYFLILAKYLKSDSLTSGQLDTLNTIASKCPKEGGMVVYSARGLLQDCSEYLYSDDYVDCYPVPDEIETEEVNEGLFLTSSSTSESSVGIKVFPNPVSDQLHISLIGLSGVTISLFDLDGIQKIKEKWNTSGTMNLELLESGIYILQIESSSGILSTQKIVIFR